MSKKEPPPKISKYAPVWRQLRDTKLARVTALPIHHATIIKMIKNRRDKDKAYRYLQMDAASSPDTYTISYLSGSAFTSGLRISCNNSAEAADVNSNLMLAARNGTIPHVVVNDQFNQLHLFPQGLAELNTSYVQNVIIGEELLIRKNLQIGTSQDNATTKLISALDSTQATGTKRYITLGKNNVSNSQGEIYFNYDSSAFLELADSDKVKATNKVFDTFSIKELVPVSVEIAHPQLDDFIDELEEMLTEKAGAGYMDLNYKNYPDIERENSDYVQEVKSFLEMLDNMKFSSDGMTVHFEMNFTDSPDHILWRIMKTMDAQVSSNGRDYN